MLVSSSVSFLRMVVFLMMIYIDYYDGDFDDNEHNDNDDDD